MNSQYLDDQRKLANAKTLRSSLLAQLQAADSTTAVDSLQLQIKDAGSAIAGDESGLNALSGRIAFSTVDVTISPAGSSAPAPAPARSGTGFTVARAAAHDALDVLKVAAGVALITLAVLIPLSLLVAYGAWLAARWRRLARR